MDLLLRGRGANISARAPLSLLRLCGAALGFATYVPADLLGVSEISGISPFALMSVAMIGGALIAPSRFGSALWIALGALATTVCLVGFTPVMRAPAQHYVRTDIDTAPVDAVVVLSASINREGYLGLTMMNRLVAGIAEARKRNVHTLALSVIGDLEKEARVTSESDQRAVVSALAPDLTVMFVRNVASTHDEALQFAALGRTHGWKRVALVTSPLHTRRSCRTFELAQLPVTCVPAAPREYSISKPGGVFSRLNVFRDVMYETAGTLAYSLRGWN